MLMKTPRHEIQILPKPRGCLAFFRSAVFTDELSTTCHKLMETSITNLHKIFINNQDIVGIQTAVDNTLQHVSTSSFDILENTPLRLVPDLVPYGLFSGLDPNKNYCLVILVHIIKGNLA